MISVAIVTPWLNHPEFMGGYFGATAHADEIIIVDTGCTRDVQKSLAAYTKFKKNGSSIYKYEGERGYSHWCNFGISKAKSDVIVCLNNDIAGSPDWIEDVRCCTKRRLYGQELKQQNIDGVLTPYIAGWAIAAHRDVWKELGGWNEAFKVGYWEDNELCFRAMMRGIQLEVRDWRLRHLDNGTSRDTPGAYDESEKNKQRFVGIIRGVNL
jgi:GT2 family glycosyltransferase